MSRNVLLGALVPLLGLAAIGVGVARLAPGGDAEAWTIAAAAAALGASAFAALLRLGRRGIGGDRGRWLVVPALLGVAFLRRLPDRWQLAVLALAAGYVGAFLAVVSIRALRLRR